MRCAVLVEEHAAFRQAMAYLLAQDLGVELVEEAATLSEARPGRWRLRTWGR